jgi:predicted esterase
MYTLPIRFLTLVGLYLVTFVPLAAQETIPPIARTLPPPGIEIPADKLQPIMAATKQLGERLTSIADHELYADVALFHKALSYATENGEFYDLKELKTANDLLTEGNRRLDILINKQTPDWTTKVGATVRGFRSVIDGSIQPYGVVVPAGLKLPKVGEPPIPIYVWLHGRGDKQTDLQFVGQRLTKPGEFVPTNGIVVHPFGRHCNAFKFAGETDVLEVIDVAGNAYSPVSEKDSVIKLPPVVLAGFSMGGAGAWHLGAHYPACWRAVSPGAGFAETARYQNITPDKLPSWYEQKLWGLYDVPGYVRNLFNVPVIAYSGELDKQIQAARIMEEAYAGEGKKLEHRIGPGMGHKYHPDVLKQLTLDLQQASMAPVRWSGPKITFQTRTLRYPGPAMIANDEGYEFCAPFVITGIDQHWQDSRLDLVWKTDDPDKRFSRELGDVPQIELAAVDHIETQHIRSFMLNTSLEEKAKGTVTIDGQSVTITIPDEFFNIFPGFVEIVKTDGRWQQKIGKDKNPTLTKTCFLQGPIDDAFYDPFLVVVPSGKSKHPAVERWVQFELAHFKDRWRRLFRGDVRIKQDTELTKEDYEKYHLIAWGDTDSNALIKSVADKLPVQWSSDKLAIGGKSFDSAGHVPVLIYPNPHPDAAGMNRYIVINSGPTYREGHDSSNSLQTPKLPDWAIVDLSVLPDAKAPGRIAEAGFFDEQWRYQDRKQP